VEKVEVSKEWDFAIIKDHKLRKLEARKPGLGSCTLYLMFIYVIVHYMISLDA